MKKIKTVVLILGMIIPTLVMAQQSPTMPYPQPLTSCTTVCGPFMCTTACQ